MDYKGKLKLELELSDKGRYLTSKQSNIYGIENSNSHLFASVDRQAIDQIDWHLHRKIIKDVTISM